MANDYFTESGIPATSSLGASSSVRAEFTAIGDGFDKLPALSGNGSKIIAVNSGATALEAITTTGTGSGVRATSPTLVTPNLGVATAYSLTLTGSIGPANGLYLPTANSVGINTNSILRLTVSTTGITLTIPILAADGTEAAPSYSFATATDRGMFLVSANKLGWVAKTGSASGRVTMTLTDGTLELGQDLYSAGALRMSSGLTTTQVLGPRITGYTNAWTGAGNRATAYDVATVTLAQLAGRVKAIQDDMVTHGMIGI